MKIWSYQNAKGALDLFTGITQCYATNWVNIGITLLTLQLSLFHLNLVTAANVSLLIFTIICQEEANYSL